MYPAIPKKIACPKLICPEIPVKRSQLAAKIENIIASVN